MTVCASRATGVEPIAYTTLVCACCSTSSLPFSLPSPPHTNASKLPSTEELDALYSGRKLNTICFFLDETFEELAFDVTTSVLEAVDQLAGIIKLQARAGHWSRLPDALEVHARVWMTAGWASFNGRLSQPVTQS